jgi:guanine nucleotide-exchange factor
VIILKSLADWEQLRRDSSKQGSIVESHEEDASRRLTTDEMKNQEDGRNQFERAKAHKSTMEAAISEVGVSAGFITTSELKYQIIS